MEPEVESAEGMVTEDDPQPGPSGAQRNEPQEDEGIKVVQAINKDFSNMSALKDLTNKLLQEEGCNFPALPETEADFDFDYVVSQSSANVFDVDNIENVLPLSDD